MSNHLLFQIAFVLVLHHEQGTTNFALHKPAVQSSTLYYGFSWTADRAVDGNTNGWDPDRSETCSATQYSKNLSKNTWEVNIGFPIIMKTITVYGRTDGGIGELDGIQLYFRNASGSSIIYNQRSDSDSSNTRYVYKPIDVIASIISLIMNAKILVLCEVTVDGECPDGIYSEFCNATCGKCIYDEPCNKRDGMCSRGCDKGWKGVFCKEECEIGTYGYNCKETCGNCLNGNDSCSKLDGNCEGGCTAGWQGFHCSRECNAGSYGNNCSEVCGYCLNGNTSCLKTSGRCTDGCQARWKGETCKSGTEEMTRPDDVPHVGVIVGSVAAAVGVSVFAISIIVFIVKKRKKTSNERRAEALTTVPQYVNLVVGNPDAAFKVTDGCFAKTNSAYSGKEENKVTENIPITNSPTGVMGAKIYAHSDYEQLQDATLSTESAYSTINHNHTDSDPTL